MLNRTQTLDRVRGHTRPWDIIVIGGGATGAGVAVDAASRGYDVLLLEQSDFGKGTSSRSTKLVHGGVRYLERGDVPLVMEALRERGIMRQNAPHLVSDLAFVVPVYAWWEGPFYGAGLRMYNVLAGKYGFGKSRNLSKEKTLAALPTIRREGLRGGVIYYDGQFDDMRFLISLLQTAAEQGAALLNYVGVVELTSNSEDVVNGVVARDAESGETFRLQARVVINATGAFADSIRRMAEPNSKPMIAPSQGIHLVFDKSFLPGDRAIMVPHTSDGRVMFAIPWNGHTLIGTTDTPIASPSLDPVPLEREIDFILQTAALYLHKAPSRQDVLSMFAGIRPLVKAGNGRDTAALSRDHTLRVDESGLLTITGGKWTTYRNMGEDCVNHAVMLGGLDEKPCVTKQLNIHGYLQHAERHGHLSVYGSDAVALGRLAQETPDLGEQLHPSLPYIAAQVVWAVRHESARTVDDVLSRRTRATFLNVRAAVAMAPRVAELMAQELGRDSTWQNEQ
ncbi:MAG TPA: FAD-dependent oxidoreductase, partial [Candidatus Acidoferrales bacterium]|nr:FAD-dependent oxidoreductase [Candidatus Acidoferrales bacterium]